MNLEQIQTDNSRMQSICWFNTRKWLVWCEGGRAIEISNNGQTASRPTKRKGEDCTEMTVYPSRWRPWLLTLRKRSWIPEYQPVIILTYYLYIKHNTIYEIMYYYTTHSMLFIWFSIFLLCLHDFMLNSPGGVILIRILA